MTVAKNPDACARGEITRWAWPVHAFVAWLVTMPGYIARFKRTRRFAPNWRYSWHGLRESEWRRDQLIAQGVAQLLAGQPLQLDDTKNAASATRHLWRRMPSHAPSREPPLHRARLLGRRSRSDHPRAF